MYCMFCFEKQDKFDLYYLIFSGIDSINYLSIQVNVNWFNHRLGGVRNIYTKSTLS
jgi:hypothetical protein